MTIKIEHWFRINAIRTCWFVLFAIGILSVSGCETLKGAGTGFKKDTNNLGTNIQSLDQWMTTHLW